MRTKSDSLKAVRLCDAPAAGIERGGFLARGAADGGIAMQQAAGELERGGDTGGVHEDHGVLTTADRWCPSAARRWWSGLPVKGTTLLIASPASVMPARTSARSHR